MTNPSLVLPRRDVLAIALALPAASRVLAREGTRSYLADYTVATFTDAEGWLLVEDDDVAGISDWRRGTLTYDFRHGATYLGIANRLEGLRGTPDALVLTVESDGGGQELTLRLADSTNQFFDTTFVRLNRSSTLRAVRSLHDLGGNAWQVFGGAGDRVPHPPLTVRAIFMSVGPGRRLGRVRLRNLSVRTWLRRDEGVRLSAAPGPGTHVALTVENLLPVANAVTLSYGLIGIDGAPHGSGTTRLYLTAGGKITHPVAVAGRNMPPVVQVTAHAQTQGHQAVAHASLVRGEAPPVRERLAGMGLHAALTTRVLPREMTPFAEQIVRCGVTWIREDFSWPQMSPLSDRVSVRRHDRALDVAAGAGLRVLGLPTGWPLWSHPYTARGLHEFLAFLRQIARRYRGRVAAWEIWNEPNVSLSWRGTAEQYVDLLVAAYATLKDIDPDVQVIGPCTAGPGDLASPTARAAWAWIERVLDSRAPLFDVFSFHPYEGRRSPEQAGFVPTVQRLQHLLRGSGHPARLWVTEQGWASDDATPALDDVQQARLLVRAYLLGRMAGVELYVWYDGRNDGWALDDREDNFGLLRRDFRAKSAYRALAVVAGVLGARRFTGVLPAPAGIFALRFVGAGAQQPVLAVWSPHTSGHLSLTLRGQRGTLCDLDGTRVPLSPGRHTCALPAGLVRFVIGDAV